MDPTNAQELMESTHDFPGKYLFKVVGWHRNEFVERVLSSARAVIGSAIEIQHTTRETASGRHISVTMEPFVDNSDQVLEIYEHLKIMDDVIMLL